MNFKGATNLHLSISDQNQTCGFQENIGKESSKTAFDARYQIGKPKYSELKIYSEQQRDGDNKFHFFYYFAP